MKVASFLFILGVGIVCAVNIVPTHPPKKCTFSEYAIIIDKSGSISNQEFNAFKNAAKKVVSVAGVSYNYNRVGLSLFNGGIEKEFYCDQHKDKPSTLKYIDQVQRSSAGSTDLRLALSRGKTLLTKRGCGERPNVFSKVIILFTDGGDSDPKIISDAENLRLQNFIILVVFIGNDLVALNRMIKVTGSANRVLRIPTIQHLNEKLVAKLVYPICTQNQKKPLPIPQPFPECTADPWDYPELKWVLSDLSKIRGNNREEKVRNAIAELWRRITDIKRKINQLKSIRKVLQMRVLKQHYYIANLVFYRISKCTILIDCKLPEWKEALLQKKRYLQKELQLLSGGYQKYLQSNAYWL